MRQNFEHELVRRPAQIQEKREIDRTYLFMRSMAKSCQFSLMYHEYLTSAFGSVVENPPADTGEAGRSLGQEDLLEEEMATHSSILAWRIPWTEEPGGLWSIALQRVGHD